jgi:phenylalanine-4-hydroxylase
MFADPDFAALSQEIGLASLGASDADIKRLAAVYWHSIEFGLLRQGDPSDDSGGLKAYGAGLLSSFGELEHSLNATGGSIRKPFKPSDAAETSFPITEYQPIYFVASSLKDAKDQMRKFCEEMRRPFYARYNELTDSIWVDRAVRTSEDTHHN